VKRELTWEKRKINISFKLKNNLINWKLNRLSKNKFKVKIKKVATLNLKGKKKNMSIRSNGNVLHTNGNRASWKKAIVTLQDGYTIDILGGDV